MPPACRATLLRKISAPNLRLPSDRLRNGHHEIVFIITLRFPFMMHLPTQAAAQHVEQPVRHTLLGELASFAGSMVIPTAMRKTFHLRRKTRSRAASGVRACLPPPNPETSPPRKVRESPHRRNREPARTSRLAIRPRFAAAAGPASPAPIMMTSNSRDRSLLRGLSIRKAFPILISVTPAVRLPPLPDIVRAGRRNKRTPLPSSPASRPSLRSPESSKSARPRCRKTTSPSGG